MPRIPDAELQQLKQDVDLAALVRSKGIELKPHGKDIIGLCPFHNDKNPSLVITPEKNLWHCLGACNAGGSTIDWIMKAEGVSFRHAVELLRSGNASSLVASDKIHRSHATVPKLEAPISKEADDQTAFRQVVSYYHKTILQSPTALKYQMPLFLPSEYLHTDTISKKW
jgi:DNA primase